MKHTHLNKPTPSTTKISHSKIIFSVIFFSITIIAALFTFHSLKKPTPKVANDNVLIFPVARDIKPFKLITANNQPFTLNQFYHHWTLIFFGFAHCSQICPTTLTLLNHVYPSLRETYPNLQVVFISLDPERDTAQSTTEYVHTYHPDFMAATGKIREIRQLQGQLGIYSQRDSNEADYQIRHTSSILLINPEGKWAGLFKYGMKPDEFVQAFKESVKG